MVRNKQLAFVDGSMAMLERFWCSMRGARGLGKAF